MNASEIAAELDALAERVARIATMSHRNPHAFYEERSEVAHAMRELAEKARGRPKFTSANSSGFPKRPTGLKRSTGSDFR